MIRLQMFVRPAAALLACAAGGEASAQPPAQPAAQPAARWHLDGSTDRCVLTRRLEGEPLAATFILRTIPGSGRYDVILAAPDLPPELRRPGRRVELGLLPVGRGYGVEAARVELPRTLGDGALFAPLPSEFGSAFAGASTLQLSGEDRRPLGRWTIPLAARAAEALAACEAEKLTDWGADPAALESGATPPRPSGNSDTWFTIRDFGLATTVTPAAFSAVFRLVVDEEGRAAECTLLESAGNVDLAGACRTLRSRARYEPARDRSGRPVKSVAIYIAGMRVQTDFRIIG